MNNIKRITSTKHRAQKCPRVSCRQGPIHLTNGEWQIAVPKTLAGRRTFENTQSREPQIDRIK